MVLGFRPLRSAGRQREPDPRAVLIALRPHRAAVRLDLGPVQRDAGADGGAIGELVEQEIAAERGDLADRLGLAGRDPQRRVRTLAPLS